MESTEVNSNTTNCENMESCCDSYKHKVHVGHVHFDENVEDHKLIGVEADGGKVKVHVGFLQTNHKYEIKFDIPNLIGNNVSVTHNLATNVELVVVSVEPTDSNKNLHVLIHLSIVKEGEMREYFSLEDEDKNKQAVMVHARILGKLSGTPMLKDGIHCLEVFKNNESLSDHEFT